MTESLGDRCEELIGDHTCVYATGSCGRLEMGKYSDLDAYVVRVDGAELSGSEVIEEAVERANRAARLRELDGDGKYAKPVTIADVLDPLGAPEDDKSGVLTKRVLLLLESQVLVGQPAHARFVDEVIDAYWQNDALHRKDYLPLVLVNDIVRYWRIVLLNHESSLRKKKQPLLDAGLDPEEADARLLPLRRYQSQKLRFPRCLTCFSALTYLLALTPEEQAHVGRDDIRKMVALTPLERLQKLPEIVGRPLPKVDAMLDLYAAYLDRNELGKDAQITRIRDDVEFQQSVSRGGGAFTKHMFELVQELGGGRPLHRHMLV